MVVVVILVLQVEIIGLRESRLKEVDLALCLSKREFSLLNLIQPEDARSSLETCLTVWTKSN